MRALLFLLALCFALPATAQFFVPPYVNFAASGAATSVSFQGSGEDTTDQTTYTFTSQPLGTIASDRCSLVAFVSRSASARSVSSVTIDGVSATAIVTADGVPAGADIASIWAAATPSADTTGTVAITFSGAMLRAAIVNYRMVGQSACTTPTATTSTTTLTAMVGTASVNVSANGDAVGMCYMLSGGTASATWSGITSDATGSPETAANAYNAGHQHFASSQSPAVITCTGDAGAARIALVSASWGP